VKIRRLTLTNFMRYKSASLELPDSGIVLVTGVNGEGKSAIICAAAVAGWARTVRGTYPWTQGTRGEVTLVTDSISVSRVRTEKDKPQLDWSPLGERGPTFETQRKGQPYLEKVIGPYDVWRKTRVFSSHDAAHFSLATDSERKLLIESMVGNDRFDGAYDKCHADFRRAESTLAELRGKQSRLVVDLAAEKRSKLENEELEKGLPPTPASLDLLIKTQQEALEKTDADLTAARAVERSLEQEARTAANAARDAERRLAAVSAGHCDQCTQDVPRAVLTRLETEAGKARDAAESRRTEVDDELETVRAEIRKLEVASRAATQKLANLRADRRAAETAADQRRRIERNIANAKAAIERMERDAAKLEGEVKDAEHERDVLDCADTVLGLKGVRAHILSKTLGSIEALTNERLAHLSDGLMQIRLRAYTEKKGGGVSDAIGLTVEGAGGGLGYAACSEGQRRRIDVSLLLALGHVAEAGYGLAPGTMFFDEVFDILDAEGKQRVISTLEELAVDRAVVIISHAEDMQSAIDPVLHLHVEGGTIYEL
jgi:DNA repair exonuclease SbcCD ATPase subunit